MSAVTKLMDEYKTGHIDASWQSFAVWLADRCATQAAELEAEKAKRLKVIDERNTYQDRAKRYADELGFDNDEIVEQAAEIERLKAELQQAREAERWIPVGERLPDEEGYYMARIMIEARFWRREAFYSPGNGWDTGYTVTHWKVLPPEPPE